MLLLIALLCLDSQWTVPLTFEAIPEHAEVMLQRPISVAADAQGRVYVLDLDARRVFIWERDGRYVGALGQSGQGPGEFDFSEWNYRQASLVSRENELWVFDGGQRKIHIFEDLVFKRTESFAGMAGRTRFFNTTRSGTRVIYQQNFELGNPKGTVALFGSSGIYQKTLLTYRDRSFDRPTSTVLVYLPFPAVYTDPSRDEIILGFGDKPQFSILDDRGRHLRDVVFSWPAPEVTREDREEYHRSDYLRDNPGYVIRFTEHHPVYYGIFPLPRQRYLVYRRSPVDRKIHGLVISEEGEKLGLLRLTCGENGDLFASRDRVFAIRVDDHGDFSIEEWRFNHDSGFNTDKSDN